jgi:hypothetical protein
MNAEKTTMPREILESVLTIPAVKRLWTFNYQPALPFTLSPFSVGAVMPAVLYLFRWGHRRGKGTFAKVYGKVVNNKSIASIENVADIIIGNSDLFEGFESLSAKAILGDMLLSSCLENKNRQTGKTEQVQRAYPTHYLSSWIDLPTNLGWLRFVPELIVAILAQQEEGPMVVKSTKKSLFSVGAGFEENILLALFGNGMKISGQFRTDLTSDHFVETDESVALDQLLSIRLAQGCGEAPAKIRGDEIDKIPNQWPLATFAARSFSEDFRIFVRAYGSTIPRQTFLQMLESCLSLGLSTIFFSTISMLFEWEKSGILPDLGRQKPWPLFVDCSNGSDMKLRRLAEESMAELFRRLERLPFVLMCLRILEDKVRNTRTPLRDFLPPVSPDATSFINCLGGVFTDTNQHAGKILDRIDEDCLRIVEVFDEIESFHKGGIDPAFKDILTGFGNPALRLSEMICFAMGSSPLKNHRGFILSLLMVGEPNGLAQKRRVYSRKQTGGRGAADATSIILTNPMLDFLVHRHLRKAAKGNGPKSLAYITFLNLMKERYGLYIDESPPGMSIPVEMLLHNKRILQRRLRDLGVLVGVNDAESMKRLRQRFSAVGDE